ncbi:MAG: SAF domain-containing protein [Anaerolineae bacterium]|nr:SAF domain-containing protein [Anaerolineae bacterium]
MRGRVLILIGAIILLVALVVVVFFVLPQDEEETGPDAAGSAQVESAGGEQPGQVGEGDTTPVVRNMVNIVVAIQDLPRGLTIPEDGVAVQPWPEDALPEAGNYFVETAEVVGRIARTDIFRGAPVLGRQVVDNLYEVAETGSDAAALMAGACGPVVGRDLSPARPDRHRSGRLRLAAGRLCRRDHVVPVCRC